MSTASVKNLTFESNNLGKESTLLLTFDSDMPGMYENYFPVAWRVATFGAKDVHSLVVIYKHQFALTKPQVQHERIIDAATAVEINVDQTTTLTKDGNVFHFSTPVSGIPGALRVVNNTGETQDIAVGFLSPGEWIPKPALFFSKFESGSEITAQFTPKLRAYITSAYDEAAILRAAIHTSPIWECDLTALDQSTTWKITWDPINDCYAITEVVNG